MRASGRLLPAAMAMLLIQAGPAPGASLGVEAGISFERAVRLGTRTGLMAVGRRADGDWPAGAGGAAPVTLARASAFVLGDLRDNVVNVLPARGVAGPGLASIRVSCATGPGFGTDCAAAPVHGGRNATLHVAVDMTLAKGVLLDGKTRFDSSVDIAIVYQ